MATVTNTIKLPDGTAPDHAAVEIELVASESVAAHAAGWITATDVTILSVARPTVTAGAWSASLTPNADIDPAGTVYRVREYAGRERYIHYIDVGSGGGTVHDLLTDPPASVPSSPLQSHLSDSVDAHDATAVSFTPTGTIAATNVQTALAEVASEAASALAAQKLYVDARDHGVLGDGTTDDTAEIQAAVDATPVGGTCVFPVGTGAFRISAPINLLEQRTYVFPIAGRMWTYRYTVPIAGSVKLTAGFSGAAAFLIRGNEITSRALDNDGIRIVGLVVDCGAASGNMHGVQVEGLCRDLSFVDCAVFNAQGTGNGWDFRTGTGEAPPRGIRMQNCAAYACDANGFRFNGVTDSNLSDLLAVGNTARGIYASNSGENSFVSCRAVFNTQDGFFFDGTTSVGMTTLLGPGTDRNGNSGILISQSGTQPIQIVAPRLRRDGASAPTSNFAGLRLSGSAGLEVVPVDVTVPQVVPGVDDDAGGIQSPQFAVRALRAQRLTIQGGDLWGVTGGFSDGGSNSIVEWTDETYWASGAIGSKVRSTPTRVGQSPTRITSGTITGITDLAIADGGTGASTAAAARTNLGLGTWVNVKDYGAVADGVTDDSAAFEAAFTAADLTTRTTLGYAGSFFSRATVYIPAGSYLITGTEKLMKPTTGSKQGLTYKGDGRGQTVIIFEPSAADSCLAKNSNQWQQITFEDMAFYSDSDTATFMESDSDGQAHDVVFNRVLWGGTWKRGVNLTGSNTNSEYVWNCCNIACHLTDGFLYVAATDTSDQFVNYTFVATDVLAYDGPLLVFHKGGNINIFGGSWTHEDPASTTPLIQLYSGTHSGGVQRFCMNGTRVEHKSELSQLIYCEWSAGTVTFISVDTTPSAHLAPSAAATNVEFVFNNARGPVVTWLGCYLSGRHKYSTGASGHTQAHRVLYEGCDIANYATAREFVDAATTSGSAFGAAPSVEFRNSRGNNIANRDPFDCIVNWEIAGRGYPTRRQVTVKYSNGLSVYNVQTQTVSLPVESLVVGFTASKAAGGASTSTNWEYVLTDGDATVVATLSAGGTTWNTAWRKAVSDLAHFCVDDDTRELTITATNIAEGSENLHLVIEYLA